MSRPAVSSVLPAKAPRQRAAASKPNGHRPPSAAPSAPALIFGDLWPYDPAPETAEPGIRPRYELFIDGEFVAPRGGRYFDSINPATEEKLAEIALAD
ncbi:MAG: hypothetical protein INR65_18765, partial [Gluconacetobacter diazotrophicus]|nr:hypothetical protein [Gluconacetobacter diazotrophicus]